MHDPESATNESTPRRADRVPYRPVCRHLRVFQYQSGETSPKAGPTLGPNNFRFARHPFLNECNRLIATIDNFVGRKELRRGSRPSGNPNTRWYLPLYTP
jgi:hypothetical protein